MPGKNAASCRQDGQSEGQARMNDYYTFNDESEEIIIHRHDTPSPWINYLSNGTLHAFVSQAGGGFAWWKSAVTFRLTRYRQYNLPIDSPGFYIYIRHEDGAVWSPTFRPVDTPLDSWQAKHTAGRSVFCASKNGIEAQLEFFITPDHDMMLWDLKLKNTTRAPVALDVFGYAELSQMDWDGEKNWGYYTRLMIRTWYDKAGESVSYLFPLPGGKIREYPLTYFASTKPVASYSGDRDHFIGPYRDERNPRGVEQNTCGNSTIECGEPAAALQNTLRIEPASNERLAFILGVVPEGCVDVKKAEKARDEKLRLARAESFVDAQKEKLSSWWREHLDIMSCSIPR
jgi:cellobiose phosphorylase